MKESLSIYMLLIFLALSSCTNKNANIYKQNRQWKYTVTRTTDLATDSISLSLTVKAHTVKTWFLFPVHLEYRYTNFAHTDSVSEWTGANDDSTEVSLHPPRMLDLSFTMAAPFPQIALPAHMGNKNTSETVIAKSEFQNLNGTVLKTELTVQDTATIATFLGPLKCHKIVGRSLNLTDKIGTYKAVYYFNPKYGFVRWEYLAPDSTHYIFHLRELSGF